APRPLRALPAGRGASQDVHPAGDQADGALPLPEPDQALALPRALRRDLLPQRDHLLRPPHAGTADRPVLPPPAARRPAVHRALRVARRPVDPLPVRATHHLRQAGGAARMIAPVSNLAPTRTRPIRVVIVCD